MSGLSLQGLDRPLATQCQTSKRWPRRKHEEEAGYTIRKAINTENNGNTGEALRIYRELFGPRFPLS